MSATKKGFDLAEVLNDVSGLDTFSVDNREQIEYISIDLIVSDPANFYELSAIDALAENIELIGLQQPIRVRQNPDDESTVIVVSGHRRMAALRKLIDEGREDLRDVPCIVDKSTGSAAMQELRLIYANSDTRVMKSADISKQVERIEKLLYQLKEEGYEFPGRMRDHVAEICKISQTKLARLKMIREKLHEWWQPAYKDGRLTESPAYELSRLPVEDQLCIYTAITEKGLDLRQVTANLIEKSVKRFKQIAEATDKCCEGSCENCGNKRIVAVCVEWYSSFHCDKCCGKCPDLAKCHYACPQLADKVKQLRADAKAARQQKKLAEENWTRPLIEQVENLWIRFGDARRAAQKTVKECLEAAGKCYFVSEEKKYEERERCISTMTPTTELPYGYSVRLDDITPLIKMADLLGCSLDYLFCRTANPVMNDAAPQAVGNSPADHPSAVWYPASVEPPVGKRIIVLANDGFAEDAVYEGSKRLGSHAVTEYPEVRLWTFVPSDDAEDPCALEGELANAPAWHPGTENPPASLDAVAYFAVDGVDPIRKLAHWDGVFWRFSKNSAAIDAKCLRWYPIPEETDGLNG